MSARTERPSRAAAGARAARKRGGADHCRLFQEDCVEGIPRRLAPGSVDVVVTSPPYNLGVRYGLYDDSLPRAQYLEWTDRWIAAVERALAPGGSLFLNVGGKPSDPWIPLEVAGVARRRLALQNTIHWVKSIAIDAASVGRYGPGPPADLAVGHYKPIRGERYLNDCHEYIFHFTRGGDVPLDRLAVGVPYRDKSNVTRWKGAAADRRCRGNTWFIPYETIKMRDRDRPHPASFPPRLPELCLRLHGLRRVRLALDPFLGIGSTAIACARLGVRFVGFELDPVYLEEARRRLAREARP